MADVENKQVRNKYMFLLKENFLQEFLIQIFES